MARSEWLKLHEHLSQEDLKELTSLGLACDYQAISLKQAIRMHRKFNLYYERRRLLRFIVRLLTLGIVNSSWLGLRARVPAMAGEGVDIGKRDVVTPLAANGTDAGKHPQGLSILLKWHSQNSREDLEESSRLCADILDSAGAPQLHAGARAALYHMLGVPAPAGKIGTAANLNKNAFALPAALLFALAVCGLGALGYYLWPAGAAALCAAAPVIASVTLAAELSNVSPEFGITN
jgi:hypothetical protein